MPPIRPITRTRLLAAGAAAVGGALIVGLTAAPSVADDRHAGDHDGRTPVKHVLLLSVDGLHQKDLDWYVRTHPTSAIAALAQRGTDYTRASTPVPSDSFPGMVAQVTGGNPGTTGVYYDDTYNHALLPAGTTDCAGVTPGAEVAYTEAADKNQASIDAGQGLSGLPGSILSMTGTPSTLLDPAQLPIDPTTCTPVYPHQYLKVNTVFEVAKQAGLHTAWSDKHPAYEILDGPSGSGVDDLFTPEINSDAAAPFTGDWTKDNLATQQYDGYKVRAVLNEIDGKDHSGTKAAPVPAIFGMNFQTVSTAQKLPTSDGLTGGYLAGGSTPGPLLSKALDYVNASVGAFTSELRKTGHSGDTTVILSAKHGQSPTDPAALKRVDDGPIIAGLNAAWAATHPGSGDLVAFSTDDDIMQLWLNDHTQAADDFAKQYLATHSVTGNDIGKQSVTVQASGLTTIFAGAGVAKYFGTTSADPRIPDVLGIAQAGVVYTGGTGKIAEHGGASTDDRNVPILVAAPGAKHALRIDAPVETTQIAPTILSQLGLDPRALQAVRIEGTKTLPAWQER